MTTLSPPVADPAATRSGAAGPHEIHGKARAFGVAVVKLALEVADRRRPVAQLDSMTSENVGELIGGLARASVRAEGPAAQVRRLHVQLRGPDTAEIFGSYTRGERVGAFAGRIEYRMTRRRSGTALRGLDARRSEYRWQLVEFVLG